MLEFVSVSLRNVQLFLQSSTLKQAQTTNHDQHFFTDTPNCCGLLYTLYKFIHQMTAYKKSKLTNNKKTKFLRVITLLMFQENFHCCLNSTVKYITNNQKQRNALNIKYSMPTPSNCCFQRILFYCDLEQ